MLQIKPLNFIKALSTALELSRTGISMHHCRTAIIAKHIGEALELGQNDIQILSYAALLHDIGAAANWDEKHKIAHDDSNDYIFNHAEAGYMLLKDSPQLSPLAAVIRHHHDRYAGGNPSGLSGGAIPLASRIIHLADRLEVSIKTTRHIFFQRSDILRMLRRNKFFDPYIIDAVCSLADKDYFWLDIIDPSYQNRFTQGLEFFGSFAFSSDDIEQIAAVFSDIVDATSSFTAAHSRNVVRICELLAKQYGYSAEELHRLRVAGLLHDIGKLSIPNEVLNKPGKLSATELSLLKQHPYYTLRILEQIDGFETIAAWAAQHHEKLNGNGYPFEIGGAEIGQGSRIMAIADVFSSLVEHRPYKQRFSKDEVLRILQDMVDDNSLDGRIVRDLKDSMQDAWALVQDPVR